MRTKLAYTATKFTSPINVLLALNSPSGLKGFNRQPRNQEP